MTLKFGDFNSKKWLFNRQRFEPQTFLVDIGSLNHSEGLKAHQVILKYPKLHPEDKSFKIKKILKIVCEHYTAIVQCNVHAYITL